MRLISGNQFCKYENKLAFTDVNSGLGVECFTQLCYN
nr:MAG TPA: hypothetical protein [Caudoviricetes sp.]